MVTLAPALLCPVVARMLGTAALRHIVVCPMADILPFPKNWLFPVFKRRELAAWPKDPAHASFAALIDNDGTTDKVAIDPPRDIPVLHDTAGTTAPPHTPLPTPHTPLPNPSHVTLS